MLTEMLIRAGQSGISRGAAVASVGAIRTKDGNYRSVKMVQFRA